MRRAPSMAIDRTAVGPESEHLGRAHDRVVRLRRAVDRRRRPEDAAGARAGQHAFARGCQRREVRQHASARTGAAGAREADELAHPAQRLALDVARRLGADREVDVVAGGEQVADHADLQSRAADEAEPARAGLGEALVEHPRRVLEHVVGGRGALREARGEQRARLVVDRRLAVACVVEARPRLGDQPAGVGEDIAARRVQGERAHACSMSGVLVRR